MIESKDQRCSINPKVLHLPTTEKKCSIHYIYIPTEIPRAEMGTYAVYNLLLHSTVHDTEMEAANNCCLAVACCDVSDGMDKSRVVLYSTVYTDAKYTVELRNQTSRFVLKR